MTATRSSRPRWRTSWFRCRRRRGRGAAPAKTIPFMARLSVRTRERTRSTRSSVCRTLVGARGRGRPTRPLRIASRALHRGAQHTCEGAARRGLPRRRGARCRDAQAVARSMGGQPAGPHSTPSCKRAIRRWGCACEGPVGSPRRTGGGACLARGGPARARIGRKARRGCQRAVDR